MASKSLSSSSSSSSNVKKSVDDLLSTSQEVITSTLGTGYQTLQRTPSPIRRKPIDFSEESGLSSPASKGIEKTDSLDENKTKDVMLAESAIPSSLSKKKKLRLGEKAKKKAWYSVLYPSYKSRCEEFKKLFKEVPEDDRLIGDYSCAIQKDILVHGRLYVSQFYLCFHANLLVYETKLVLKWKDVSSIVKDKTARVIPNAISVYCENDKYFFTSFTSRDKTHMILFRVWQNTLMEKALSPQELWQQVHRCYGDELGLTTDDEDYIDPTEPMDGSNVSTSTTIASKLSNESGSGDMISDVTNSSKDKTASSSSSGQLNSANDSDSKAAVKKPTTLKLSKTSSAAIVPTGKSKLTNNKKADLSPVEQLPTDMSDSSESETGNTATDTVREQAECDSQHEGRQLVHTILPINVETLFGLLFNKSKFFAEFHESRRTTNLEQGEWQIGDNELKVRQVKLTVAINQAVGPKSSHVTEIQTLRPCSRDNSLYAIDIQSTNAGIPYADSFTVELHYCMQHTQDDHTVLSVHAQIKYKKNVWGFVKGFIEKNTWAGLEEFFQALLKALQSEYGIPPAKVKARKSRRNNGGSSKSNTSHHVASEQQTTHSSGTHKDSVSSALKKLSLDTPASSMLASDTLKHEKFLSWMVIVMLVALIVINAFLYYKLRGLEEIADVVDTSEFLLKYTTRNGQPPQSQADWLNLLQQQEAYHAREIQKWHGLLHSSIDMLKKIESTLAEVQSLMHVERYGGATAAAGTTKTAASDQTPTPPQGDGG